jgi:hypothetical protein
VKSLRHALVLGGLLVAPGIPAWADTAVDRLPRAIQLGQSIERLRPILAEDCNGTERLDYEGEMAAPFTSQTQVNCAGLEAFGGRRRAEFMFDDGPLGHVWILVQAEEIEGLRSRLEAAFGRIVFKTESYEVFRAGTVALRSYPPEILVATPALIERMTGYRAGATGSQP